MNDIYFSNRKKHLLKSMDTHFKKGFFFLLWSLSYHHLAHRAVAHAHDVQAAVRALLLPAVQVVDALDGCLDGTVGYAFNARCFAVDVEEVLPLVGRLVGRDATFGNRQFANRLVDIGKSKQATNRRNSCKAVDTGVQ